MHQILPKMKNETTHIKRILITGDIMQHEPQHEFIQTLKGSTIEDMSVKLFSAELIDLLQSADVVLGNLETLVANARPRSGYPFFNTHEDFLWVLKHIGFTDLIVTNNHSKDITYNAWKSTVANCLSSGFTVHGFRFDQVSSLTGIDDLMVIAGADKFNKEFDAGRVDNFYKEFQPVTKHRFYETIKQFSNIKEQIGNVSNYLTYLHIGEEYNTSMSNEQITAKNIIDQIVTEECLATFFVHSHVIGDENQQADDAMKFVNGLGNFCSMQESLDRQIGRILMYDYNVIDKTLKYVGYQDVETILAEDGSIQTGFAKI
jgi:hypothetical protein